MADGLFEKFPMDAVFGLHNWPGIPVGEMAVMPGPVMAGTCAFEIWVRGQGCHAAMPHQGVDTLVVTGCTTSGCVRATAVVCSNDLIAAGVHGEPTRFLATFDPVASPAQLVAGSGDVSTGEVLARFVASTDALVGLCSSLDHAGWSAAAEAPPGHVSVSAVAHHALWDSWVHERDVLVPLGLAPEPEADEVAACLRYVAALGPALALNRGAAGSGVLAIDATGPDVVVVVDIGEEVVVRAGAAGAPTVELRLAGDAVELLEALSVRRPLTQLIPADSVWMLRGLSDTFDVAPD